MITTRPQTRYRAAGLGAALVGIALALGGCQHDEATASIPDDYKQRHPIAIEEQNRSIVVFVGHARGGLTAAQRADVMGLASTWMHEGTGAIHIDVPSGTPNARPVAESMREIQAMLAAAGVPRAASSHVPTSRKTSASCRPSGSPIPRSPRLRAPAACGRRISAPR